MVKFIKIIKHFTYPMTETIYYYFFEGFVSFLEGVFSFLEDFFFPSQGFISFPEGAVPLPPIFTATRDDRLPHMTTFLNFLMVV